MRPKPSIEEYYHVYNRGTDKRDIFISAEDTERFFLCMSEFNTIDPVGSIFELRHGKHIFGGPTSKSPPLVDFVAYCLNPNHYHLVLKQVVENGIPKFLQRIGTGYTMYFNEKYKRNGVLFQGKYKAKHIPTNEYLLHVVTYVNLNFKIHPFGGPTSKLWMSSWDEYVGKSMVEICRKDVILEQFRSHGGYEAYARGVLPSILKRKENEKELQKLLLE
ncbi:MAG: transposase [Patescibacteria group bacterium]